jgi:hypothetical protein
MDADKLEAMLAEAVKQYAKASPADRPAIAEAAAGAIDALVSALDDQDRHTGVRQLAALLIAERASAEGRSATGRRPRGTPTGTQAPRGPLGKGRGATK